MILPKHLLDDAEKGDRTKEFLKDEPVRETGNFYSDSLQQIATMQGIGNAWGGNQMGGLLAQQQMAGGNVYTNAVYGTTTGMGRIG